MNTKVNVLLAPKIKEAVGDKLSVGKLENVASGVVPVYSEARAGDVITFDVVTSTGNDFQSQHVLNSSEVGHPVLIQIPKDVFSKGLVQGATADISYTVSQSGTAPRTSLVLKLHLEK
jgi:hypothetical protein